MILAKRRLLGSPVSMVSEVAEKESWGGDEGAAEESAICDVGGGCCCCDVGEG